MPNRDMFKNVILDAIYTAAKDLVVETSGFENPDTNREASLSGFLFGIEKIATLYGLSLAEIRTARDSGRDAGVQAYNSIITISANNDLLAQKSMSVNLMERIYQAAEAETKRCAEKLILDHPGVMYTRVFQDANQRGRVMGRTEGLIEAAKLLELYDEEKAHGEVHK